MIAARPSGAVIEQQNVTCPRKALGDPVGVVLGEELLICFRAGAVDARITPAIKKIAAFAATAALVAGRLGGCRAMVDDPELAEFPDADHDLIEFGVVGYAVEVR